MHKPSQVFGGGPVPGAVGYESVIPKPRLLGQMRQVLRSAACSLKFETGARQRRLERLVRRSGALEGRQDNSPGQGRRPVLPKLPSEGGGRRPG